MDKRIKLLQAQYMKKDIPAFNVGDTVDVQVKIMEEGKRAFKRSKESSSPARVAVSERHLP